MKRLMSDEELRVKLEQAYYAGWNEGNWPQRHSESEFDEWYEDIYCGPDCE